MIGFVAIGLLVCSQSATVGDLPPGPVSIEGLFHLNGKASKLSPQQSKATVLLYLGIECPIANRYAPEINRIVAAYSLKNVTFARVYVEDHAMASAVRQHGIDYGLKFVPLLDPERKVLKTLGVTVTPEAVVLGVDGVMRYRGRIDDQNIEHGKVKPSYRRDLRIALDEVLAGKPVSVPVTAAIGCYIGAGS